MAVECESISSEHETPFRHDALTTPNLRTNIMDFRRFDSNIILILRGGIPRPIGNFPENLSQGILAGIILAGILLVGIILVGII